MSQDSVDKKLKEWNDTWFGSKVEIREHKKDIPGIFRHPPEIMGYVTLGGN